MVKIYRYIWELMTSRERKRFLIVLSIAILSALFDAIGVASIFPFLRVLSDPDILYQNGVFNDFFQQSGISDPTDFILLLGVGVFALIVLSMAVRALSTYVQVRFGLMRAYALSAKLLEGTLTLPYVLLISRHSAELGQAILSEVTTVVHKCILPAILLLANGATAFAIIMTLIIIEPAIALSAAGFLISIYVGVYLGLKGVLGRIGSQRLQANKDQYRITQEATGGVKELKLLGLEKVFLARFQKPAHKLAQTQTQSLLISSMPRFALEGMLYGGFILLIMTMSLHSTTGMVDAIPLLGLIGMAGSRLLPILQQIYNQATTLRFSEPGLQKLCYDFREVNMLACAPLTAPHLPLASTLQLQNTSFSYPDTKAATFENLSLTIPANTTVGLVGGTGAGKTTVVDLILGLLEPSAGQVLVDGNPLNRKNIRGWQRNIGYVPQHIFLSDSSISENIAFGQEKGDIDMAAVERAAKIANLHNFVTEELPEGYDTMVGERGVRLSGGQRQRIGIARALYHDPGVLILDEATSALDNVTERAVMEAVHNIGHAKTIIMIAHRLSTVEKCDKIFVLEKGELVGEGTYDELVAGNDIFRKMAVG